LHDEHGGVRTDLVSQMHVVAEHPILDKDVHVLTESAAIVEQVAGQTGMPTIKRAHDFGDGGSVHVFFVSQVRKETAQVPGDSCPGHGEGVSRTAGLTGSRCEFHPG
jgi:hypothetical protein